jgi:hypothetical protein
MKARIVYIKVFDCRLLIAGAIVIVRRSDGTSRRYATYPRWRLSTSHAKGISSASVDRAIKASDAGPSIA